MKIANIRKHLNSWGKEFVREARKNLVKSKKGGGNLENSLDFKVKGNQHGFEVELMMADYGTFVDKGVKGTGGILGPKSKNPGAWSGRRWYMDWKGKRQDSPYKFGSGRGPRKGIYKGIGSFIKKKGLQPRSAGGKYMTTAGLKIAIVKTLWIKGIHGISFFQKALRKKLAPLIDGIAINLGQDIVDYILAKYPNSYEVKPK